MCVYARWHVQVQAKCVAIKSAGTSIEDQVVQVREHLAFGTRPTSGFKQRGSSGPVRSLSMAGQQHQDSKTRWLTRRVRFQAANQIPDGGIAVADSRWRHCCRGFQMAALLSRIPDGGIAVAGGVSVAASFRSWGGVSGAG